jgi:hypothetical protein
MPDLANFQTAFDKALAGAPGALAPWASDRDALDAALSVHRNSIAKACVDALAASFPTVEVVTGQAWFDACALAFARAHPPRNAALIGWGEAFPAWLADFEPARDLPYLPAMAALDRLWLQAHVAPDATPADAALFAALSPEQLIAAPVRLHPSLGLAWFDTGLAELWGVMRPPATPPDEVEISAAAGGAAILRPGLEVETLPLDAGAYAFLTAGRGGARFGEAALAALEAAPDTDLQTLFAALIGAGVFIPPAEGSEP